MLKTPLLISTLLFAISVSKGQPVPNTTIKKIDGLFAEWQSDKGPGFMVGIVRNDSLVFSKGYGMANLEYSIPISDSTRFYIASVSKQFTGYCLTLLARQKKVNLDEDIRIYLPWFPDLKKKITVQNLLNHTSGIRDDINLMAISGLGIDGVLTNDLVVKTLKMQQALNFNPGERYSYSNSNYVLLAEIVKSVSGQSLRQFADSAIFRPLKMSKTLFLDNPSELVPDRAISYYRNPNGVYSNAFQNIYCVGDGGMFTTVGDMSKWIMNFYDPRAGDSRDIEALTKTGSLTGGKRLSYASGIIVGEDGGWKMYSHAGGLHGYRSFVSVYPELKLGFIIFGNVPGNVNGKIKEVSQLFIDPKKSQSKTSSALSGAKILSKDSVLLKKYVGEYISDEGYVLTVTWKHKKLSGFGFNQYFEVTAREGENTFGFPSANNPLTKLVLKEGTRQREFKLEFPDEVLHFAEFDNSIAVKPEDVVGEYYSAELDCSYRIELRDGKLFLTNPIYPDSRLTLRETHLTMDSWYMNHMKILLDKNKVTGFEVNSGRVMHLKFVKVK